MNPIDDYLAQLAPLLPPRGRRRILAEVEAHLHEAAAEQGEAEAVARFGAARDVAAGFVACAADRSGRRLLVVAASLVAAQVLLLIAPVVPHHWRQAPVAPYTRLLPVDVYLYVTDAHRWLAFAAAAGLACGAVAALRRARLRRAAVAVLGVLTATLGAYVAAGWVAVGRFPFAHESDVLLALALAAPVVLHLAARGRTMPRLLVPLATGVGLVGLIGLALPGILVRLVDLSYADTSAFGTAVRVAQQAWLVGAAAALGWSVRDASRRQPA
jgi:HAAS domain-containing protein